MWTAPKAHGGQEQGGDADGAAIQGELHLLWYCTSLPTLAQASCT